MVEHNLIKFDKFFEQLLLKNGLGESSAHFFNLIILGIIVILIAIIANSILKYIIIKIIKKWVDKSPNTYDDVFYEKGVFNRLSHLAPALIIIWFAPLLLSDYPASISFLKTAMSIYIIIVVLLVIISIINALYDIFNSTPVAKNRSIKGYVQMAKGVIYFIGSLMILSILIKKDLSTLFAGLTAFAAVLMFVFKDPILGLIAGIQLSSNDILRIGDYIEMPNRNTDGIVIDISLSVVKVHNTNRTISTIPTYAFISETFWNWRGLDLAESRRIKRFLYLDLSSIKYCDDELLQKLRKIENLKSYFELQDKEYAEKNIWEGKHYTNATLFRKYLESFLKSNTLITTDSTFVIRYLQPTEHGLPIEIFIYVKEKLFTKFESIQADILDHIISIVPEFGLRLFQKPAGHDVRNA